MGLTGGDANSKKYIDYKGMRLLGALEESPTRMRRTTRGIKP